MSYLASLLRGCGILQHVTARFSTVGYITQHAKGTRSKDIVLLTFSPPPPQSPFQITGWSKLILSGDFQDLTGV